MAFRADEGADLPMTLEEWLDFADTASWYTARAKAKEMGVDVIWEPDWPRSPEGYYQIQGGIPYAIAKSLAVAPYADLLWMETKTADLDDAREFAEAIHAVYPDQMLAYNLSPSFNWDTTGMTDEEMRAFPEELGKMGFVFNFITYGGHQIDGLAAEEFTTALREDGMLALARLQRKFRLLESPYRTPQTLVGGPRADAALASASGQTAMTKAMGEGSTQSQHLVQTEVPPKVLEGWLADWAEHHEVEKTLKVSLRPHTAGSELLELSVLDEDDEKLANIVFATLQDRRGRSILSVRDQNTFDTVAAAQAPDDAAAPVPHPPLQGGGDPLPDADRGQPPRRREHAAARHLREHQRGGRGDHRRRGQLGRRRRAGQGGGRAGEADHEDGLSAPAYAGPACGARRGRASGPWPGPAARSRAAPAALAGGRPGTASSLS